MKFKVGDIIVRKELAYRYVYGPILGIIDGSYTIENNARPPGDDVRNLSISYIDEWYVLNESSIIDRVLGKYLPGYNQ